MALIHEFCMTSQVSPDARTAGYYSIGGTTRFSNCASGYRCGGGAVTSTPGESLCPIGSYYSWATMTYCPAGSYGNTTGGQSQQDACSPCEAGSVSTITLKERKPTIGCSSYRHPRRNQRFPNNRN